MADQGTKQRRILDVAEQMFRDRGVERTTIAGVAKASKVPLGSLTYRFKFKADLAAAVLDRVEGVLVQDAKGALGPKGRSVAEDLRALLATGVEWTRRHGRLVAMLEPFASASWDGRSTRLMDRLYPVLAHWAARRGAVEVAAFSPGQLYAVVLAPGLCPIDAAVAIEPADANHAAGRWVEVLVAAALAAITPPNAKGPLSAKEMKRSTKTREPKPPQQGDLLSRIGDVST